MNRVREISSDLLKRDIDISRASPSRERRSKRYILATLSKRSFDALYIPHPQYQKKKSTESALVLLAIDAHKGRRLF